jgi:hypothetical protein
MPSPAPLCKGLSRRRTGAGTKSSKDFGTLSFQESVARALWTLAGHAPIKRAMIKMAVILIRITCPAL